MTRILLFAFIVALGWPIIWLLSRRAQKTRTVSFFGFAPTRASENPDKFARVVKSYRLQMVALPFIAAIVAWSIELPQ